MKPLYLLRDRKNIRYSAKCLCGELSDAMRLLCLTLAFMGFALTADPRPATAGTLLPQDYIMQVCRHFVERIETKAGERNCAVVVGSLFDADTHGPSRMAAQAEKAFFKAMLRQYASRANRMLFHLKTSQPLKKTSSEASGKTAYMLPAQARTLIRKYGCAFLTTGWATASGNGPVIEVDLVDLATKMVVAGSADIPRKSKEVKAEETKPAASAMKIHAAKKAPARLSLADRPPPVAAKAGDGAKIPKLIPSSAGLRQKGEAAEAGSGAATVPFAGEAKSGEGIAKTSSPAATKVKETVAAAAEPEQKAPPTFSDGSVHTVIIGDNFRYEGEVKNGKRWGTGTLTFDNSESYIGQWKNGLRDGQGTYTYAGGDRYEGQWREGKMCGHGIYYYKSGNRYEGGFKNDMRHGRGIFYFTNGDRRDVTYRNGKRYGRAVYIWADGKRKVEQ